MAFFLGKPSRTSEYFRKKGENFQEREQIIFKSNMKQLLYNYIVSQNINIRIILS